MVPEREPFKRLLVQGVIKGKSYRLKGTGKYLKEHEVEIIGTFAANGNNVRFMNLFFRFKKECCHLQSY